MPSAKVYRLLPNRERIKRQEAADADRTIATLNLPRHLQERIRHELYRSSEPDNLRTPFGKYVMLSVQQVGAIWDAIRDLPAKARPHEVRHAFDLAILNLRQDTGEIMLTRDELAERMKCTPEKVSKAMGQLAKMGVIIKGERRRVAGLKGPGPVPYFVNPHAAWNGSLGMQELEAQRQTPPLLRLMEGGKND
jgi:CRP-like cAMP-binding protein